MPWHTTREIKSEIMKENIEFLSITGIMCVSIKHRLRKCNQSDDDQNYFTIFPSPKYICNPIIITSSETSVRTPIRSDRAEIGGLATMNTSNSILELPIGSIDQNLGMRSII